jgi:hypothetical protein
VTKDVFCPSQIRWIGSSDGKGYGEGVTTGDRHGSKSSGISSSLIFQVGGGERWRLELLLDPISIGWLRLD